MKPIEVIRRLVLDNPNDMMLGEVVRQYIKELETEYNNKQYQRDRVLVYPSIEEQLDMQYWDKINNTNNWETKITEIKNKYPKNSED